MLIFWIVLTKEKALKVLEGLSLSNVKGKHPLRGGEEIGLEVWKYVIQQVVERESKVLQFNEWL